LNHKLNIKGFHASELGSMKFNLFWFGNTICSCDHVESLQRIGIYFLICKLQTCRWRLLNQKQVCRMRFAHTLPHQHLSWKPPLRKKNTLQLQLLCPIRPGVLRSSTWATWTCSDGRKQAVQAWQWKMWNGHPLRYIIIVQTSHPCWIPCFRTGRVHPPDLSMLISSCSHSGTASGTTRLT